MERKLDSRPSAPDVIQAPRQLQPCHDSSPFRSILFSGSGVGLDIDSRGEPEFFNDLNLDQIVASITAGREEYNLRPFFYTPLRDVETIQYRHDVYLDLTNRALLEHVLSFAKQMRTVRDQLAQAEELHYKYQIQSWFLEAAEIYRIAVTDLARDLTSAELSSSGFQTLRDYLTSYTESEGFCLFSADTEKLRADLSNIKYSLDINGALIKVEGFSSDSDYGADVLQTFEKFKQGEAKKYRFNFSSGPEMNHVEAAILDLVARLNSSTFLSLEQFYNRHRGFLDSTICVFDREIQFYIAYLDYIERSQLTGLCFCYPTVTDESKEEYGRDVFDLSLADRLIPKKTAMVTNDFYMKHPERIFVVSGPNQGGKTTFARMFGQIHYLAAVGCPVPGREVRLFLFDSLFTLFEKEEHLQNLTGKLEDDLVRIHRILAQATSKSILVMNESFISTTLRDALFLSKQIMEQIIRRGMLCVSVTFLDELASMSDTIVSMVSTVQLEDPRLRTFKIMRKPADGRAYALAIAEKYRLSYECIKERIAT